MTKNHLQKIAYSFTFTFNYRDLYNAIELKCSNQLKIKDYENKNTFKQKDQIYASHKKT